MMNEMTIVGLDGIELIWDTNTIAVLTAIAMRIITMLMRMSMMNEMTMVGLDIERLLNCIIERLLNCIMLEKRRNWDQQDSVHK